MQQRNKSKSPRTRQKTKKDRENDQHFCTTEMQIIVCSLLVSYILVFFVFKLADKDFSILYTVKQSHVNIDIYNLLPKIQDINSFSTNSMLQTNVEYDDIVAYMTSPTKSLKIDPQSACASSVEGTCRSAGNIFDKDPKSRWSSMWENKQYISFRIDQTNICNTISQISIIWETAAAKEYAIEISNNGNNWTEIGHFKTNRKNWKVHTDLITLASPICCVPLWRINCISRATKYGFSIHEIVLIKKDDDDNNNNNDNIKKRVRKCKRLLKAIKVLSGTIKQSLLPCEKKDSTAMVKYGGMIINNRKSRRRVKNRPYAIFPEPSKLYKFSRNLVTFQLHKLKIVGVDDSKPFLQNGIKIWKEYMKKQFSTPINYRKDDDDTDDKKDRNKEISTISITILSKTAVGEEIDFFENVESYKLHIPNKKHGKIQIQSKSEMGILRGLTTLLQLCQHYHYIKSDNSNEYNNRKDGKCHGVNDYCYEIPGVPIFIRDEPYLKYRGLLVDSARVHLTALNLQQIIDTMFMMKFNVLHWHLSDDVHFGLKLMWYKNKPLWEKGACSPEEVLEKTEVQAIVQYANERGILIIPELDLPGHALSWTKSFPDLLATKACGTWGVPIDVTRDSAYAIVKSVYLEVYEWFNIKQSKFLHLGGDEINEKCWEDDPEIKKRAEDLKIPIYGLASYFFFNIIRVLNIDIDENINTIIWQESAIPLLSVYNKNRDVWPVKKTFLIHIWKTKEWENTNILQDAESMPMLTKENFKFIMSKGWYLNDDDQEQCKTFKQCYKRNPDIIVNAKLEDENNNYNKEQSLIEVEEGDFSDVGSSNANKLNIFGGEVSMWETHPETIPTMYKRMAAISDRMWNKQMERKIKGILKKEKKADEYVQFLNGVLL